MSSPESCDQGAGETAPVPRRLPAAERPATIGGRVQSDRPSRLVHCTKAHTPKLVCRTDDVGRHFVYVKPPELQGKMPPPQDGQRRTERLSSRGVRQLKGASLKAVKLGVGFRAFWTLTVRERDRELVQAGAMVLGEEVRRTMTGMREWFRRRGKTDFVYAWVAENPGDDNPHVHLLTNYLAKREEFAEFAGVVEGLWTHGWVHMERLRSPKGAGKYLLKAVGYLSKGEAESQGTVYGNRYGIAQKVLPRYERRELEGHGLAAEAVRDLCDSLSEDVERMGSAWLTRFGVSFPPGTDQSTVLRFIEVLEQAVGERPKEG